MDQDTLQVPFLAGSMADNAFTSESNPSSTPTGALPPAGPPPPPHPPTLLTPALYQASISCCVGALAASRFLLISSSVPAFCKLGYDPKSTSMCMCSFQQGHTVKVYTNMCLIAY